MTRDRLCVNIWESRYVTPPPHPQSPTQVSCPSNISSFVIIGDCIGCAAVTHPLAAATPSIIKKNVLVSLPLSKLTAPPKKKKPVKAINSIKLLKVQWRPDPLYSGQKQSRLISPKGSFGVFLLFHVCACMYTIAPYQTHR